MTYIYLYLWLQYIICGMRIWEICNENLLKSKFDLTIFCFHFVANNRILGNLLYIALVFSQMSKRRGYVITFFFRLLHTLCSSYGKFIWEKNVHLEKYDMENFHSPRLTWHVIMIRIYFLYFKGFVTRAFLNWEWWEVSERGGDFFGGWE